MSIAMPVPSLFKFSRAHFSENRLLSFADGDGGGAAAASGDGGAGAGTGAPADKGSNQGGDGNGTGNGKPPEPVPYDRFKEVNEKLTKLQQEADTRAQKDEQERQKKLTEEGKFQDIINDLTPKAERAALLEKSLTSYLDAELKDVPENLRSLIPDGLSVEAKLEYIAKNRAILHGDGKRTVNTSTSPGNGSGEGGETFTLEQLQDPAFYEKNRDAILKAQKEGRIK